MTAINLRFFGSVAISNADGREADTLPHQPKLLGLLSYLAVAQPRGFHRRDKLVALFWPEASHEQARHSLSQALHVLRSELGERVLRGRGDNDVAIDEASISCDVVEFERAVEAGEYELALELYRGDLLEGLFVRDASELERWLEDERTRLREKAAGAAWQLAHQHIAAGHLVIAERTAQRALQLVATDESEVRQFIQALADAGDRAAAVRFYERFAQRLQAEYEIEPAPVTVEYAQRIRNGKSPADRVLAAQKSTETGHKALATPSGGITRTGTAPVDRVAKSRWLALGAAGAAAAILAVMAVVAGTLGGSGAALDPDRVVVALFENRTPDASLDPLGPMAGHWITQGLQKSGVMQVVPWMEAQQAARYVTSEIDAENVRNPVRALAEETGAGIVVSGAYYRRGETIQYQVEVIDATRGEPLGTLDPATAPLESPDDVIESLRERVVGLLAFRFDERLAPAEVVARKPPTFDAYRAFDRGLQLYLESGGYDRDAIPHLREAAEIDTTFLTPLIYAALVLWNNRNMREADSSVSILEAGSDKLSDYDRSWVEYIRGRLEGNNERALRAMRRAAELAPGSKAVYNRAHTAALLNHPQEALDAMRSLDPERGPMRGYAAYFTPLLRAYALLGDHEAELQAATRQRELYTDVAGRAWALGSEAFALAALGRVDEVKVLLDELDFGPTEGVSSRDGLIHGQVLFLTAARLRIHGHAEAAQVTADRAIRWFEGKPAQIVEARAWRWTYAEALYVGERWNEAYDVVRQLAKDYPEDVNYQGFLGAVAARLGDHDTAERAYQWLEGKDRRFGQSAVWQARIAAVTGEREKAAERLADAISQSMEHYPHAWLWIDFESLRGYEPFDKLMQPKG